MRKTQHEEAENGVCVCGGEESWSWFTQGKKQKLQNCDPALKFNLRLDGRKWEENREETAKQKEVKLVF